jgi:hypothetical protein
MPTHSASPVGSAGVPELVPDAVPEGVGEVDVDAGDASLALLAGGTTAPVQAIAATAIAPNVPSTAAAIFQFIVRIGTSSV